MNNNRKINNKVLVMKEMLLRAREKDWLSSAASITVEASLVLPIFIFFFVNILGVFDILKLQCDMEAALHQTGSEIFETAGLIRCGGGDHGAVGDLAGKAATAAYAGKKVKNYLGEDYLNNSSIVNKSSGLSFAESAISSNSDIVDIVVSYKVNPLFKIASFTDFGMETRFYGHAFTGYDIKGDGADETGSEEEMVYVTEYGVVYHRSLGCSHLKQCAQAVSKAGVSAKRNKDGSKYYPCEYCKSNLGDTVYITEYGNRYHSNINCTGMKRTIFTVPISEAAGKAPCSECG